MKKVFTILLAALLMMTLVPLAAVPASADEVVVYVKDKGTGDGSSPENAVSTMAEAYALIGDNDGTIVIVGTFYHEEVFEAPAHKGTVTITGVYNGVDYKGEYACLTTDHFICSGDTVFKNMTLRVMDKTALIRARFHHLTFGEGFQTTTDDFSVIIPQLYVVGGDQDKESLEDTAQDIHVTIKSGTFQEVIGGTRSYAAPSDYTGHILVEVGGADTRIAKLTLGSRGSTSYMGTGTLVLDGGQIDYFTCAHANKAAGFFNGKAEVILTKNFSFEKSHQEAGARINGERVFQGLSGASCWFDYYPDTILAETVLKIDSSVYDAIMASEMYDADTNPNGKILAQSFTAIEKADNSSYELTYEEPATGTPYEGGSVETQAPAETEAPKETEATKETEAPKDTKAATETKSSTVTEAAGTQAPAQSGEKSGIPAYVWAIVAVVVVAAVAGIIIGVKKKKN